MVYWPYVVIMVLGGYSDAAFARRVGQVAVRRTVVVMASEWRSRFL